MSALVTVPVGRPLLVRLPNSTHKLITLAPDNTLQILRLSSGGHWEREQDVIEKRTQLEVKDAKPWQRVTLRCQLTKTLLEETGNLLTGHEARAVLKKHPTPWAMEKAVLAEYGGDVESARQVTSWQRKQDEANHRAALRAQAKRLTEGLDVELLRLPEHLRLMVLRELADEVTARVRECEAIIGAPEIPR
jgi:hypothetical protein